MCLTLPSFFFFFNDTATTEIYTLSLHDALPICALATSELTSEQLMATELLRLVTAGSVDDGKSTLIGRLRSEEHTSELQSPCNLVCRLLLEKKKKFTRRTMRSHRKHGGCASHHT